MSKTERPAPPSARQGAFGGVAWYTPALFRALRKAGLEPAPGCADWDEWFATYQRAFTRLRDEGVKPLKIVIDPGDLARWLASAGREHSIEVHAEYVAWRLSQLVAEGTA